MADSHFHPVKIDDLDADRHYHWQMCPDCQQVYFVTTPGDHACILPHMDTLVPAEPVIDPQPRLAAASFCRSCGFIITSPEADLVHSENCAAHNVHPLYTGSTLCPIEDQSGSA